ncbi:hypothetical protein F4X33_14270 [Candidatus Poribacteria bacterium]|nr:hypothetical protein [Candidatus Poribacteria bacterium]
MPKFIIRTTHSNQASVSATEFSLETAYGSVIPAPDDRDLNDIIRDVKDEKGSPKSSTTLQTSTKPPKSKDKSLH